MFVMFNILIVSVIFMIYGVVGSPTQISAIDKNFKHDANFPNVHFTLLSIEDKLRNLENKLSVQCAAALDGKIDYYGRKIDNIEKDFTRFQIFIKMELENISENISSKNFKDDITKDRIIRKIDAVYERIHHKLGNLEGQLDISSLKSQNGREMVISKLEKMEESLTIRDADMEAELADAVAAIDDLKTTCSNMEENILNVTKESSKALFKTNEKLLKKQHGQTLSIIEGTNKTLSEDIASLYEVVDSMINQTNEHLIMVKETKEELDENLNEYANKITDMYSDLWLKTDDEHRTFQTIEKILNLTRSEQQNGLRALMVQVGRSAGKQSDQGNSATDNQKLDELSQKIDLNFENIMQAQNLFLESCHRVQMDEPQLETQISMVLHKVIDIFEKKTSVGPKDIEKLAHLIHTHDSNVRSNIYQITNTLLASARETTGNKDEIIDYITNQKLQLETVYVLLQDVLNSNDSAKIEKILETLQGVQLQLNETNKQVKTSQLQANLTNSFINQIINRSPDNVSKSNSIKLQQVLEFIKNIYHILMGMEMKINKSYLDYYFNKYNIDVVAHRFGQQLNKYIQNQESNTKQTDTFKIGSTKKKQISDLILEIYPEYLNENQTNLDADFNNSRQDSETAILLCSKTTDASIKCEKINITAYNLMNISETTPVTDSNTKIPTNPLELHNTTRSLSQNNTNLTSIKCLPNYINLIDVRMRNNGTMPDCDIDTNLTNSSETTTDLPNAASVIGSQNQTILPPVINNTALGNNCLPNYIDLLDVRSNDGSNKLNCTNLQNATNLNETVRELSDTSMPIQNLTYLPPATNNTLPDKCLPNYSNLIDVRNNDESNMLNCTDENEDVQNSTIGELRNTTTQDTPPKNQTEINSECSPDYINLIDVRSRDYSNTTNCTNLRDTLNLNETVRELNNATSSESIQNQTNLVPITNETAGNKCSPNYIDLIDVRSNDGTNSSNCNNTDVSTMENILPSAETTESTDNDESYDIDVRYTSNTTDNSVGTNLDNTGNINTQKVSFIEEIATDLPKDDYNTETTETPDKTAVTHIYEEQVLSQTEQVDEDNYVVNLLEDVTTEINEYEYTNHEYH